MLAPEHIAQPGEMADERTIDLHRLHRPGVGLDVQACQGLITAAPAAAKGLVSLVATVKPTVAARAAM